MLESLHVKNLALLKETEVEFGPGLNILTGETGAGKSLLLGSINLALGAKFDKDMLRAGEEAGFVELVFDTKSVPKALKEKLTALDIPFEDESIIITRKLSSQKSTCRINSETLPVKTLKEVAEFLLDIHGQHEHQSLLHAKKHLEILDAFLGAAGFPLKEAVAAAYQAKKEAARALLENTLDEAARAREKSLAEFEYNEIDSAMLTPGEDEALESRYQVMVNAQKITDSLGESYAFTGEGTRAQADAADLIARALRALGSVTKYDARLQELEGQLLEIESLLGDYNREVAGYLADCEFDEESFSQVEERLNLINHLKGKYGRTIEDVLAYAAQKEGQIKRFADYDSYMAALQKQAAAAEQAYRKACEKLSALRKAQAVVLEKQLKEALESLNFLAVDFAIDIQESAPTIQGTDKVEFLISTNPGEAKKPLGAVASGGELSRIMLAIKTVLAKEDEIDTLIFDEIDAGISGKTAWQVAKRLHILSQAHQVICITHLPQIAAMADHHFLIEKSADEKGTTTRLYPLDAKASDAELARLLGSDTPSAAALENARAMRTQALQFKEEV